jgi:hypothetical protein
VLAPDRPAGPDAIYVRCHARRSWSLRSAWRGDGPGFDFTIACPTCAVASDIADVPMRLMPPEGWHDESPTAALALRVAAALRSTAEDVPAPFG